jgi:glucokinase
MYLGIEIGGTKLQLGVGYGDGTLAGLWRGNVDVAAGPDGIRQQITTAIAELLAQAGVVRGQICGVGVGFGGPVDDATQSIIKSHQIDGWDGFPLADWIADITGAPATLGNDADVAGLGEALFGAGKGLSPIFYVTIGSGVGGGLIVNGEIYRGCGRGAAEIGHLRLPSPTDQTQYVTVEELSSGWALEQEARRRSAADHGAKAVFASAGGTPECITTPHLGQAAAKGDAFALSVLRPAQEALAEAICHVIALLCPRRIVIGGGVSLLGEELLFQPLRKLVAERVFKPFAECYDIVPAALGEEVVVHGALALVVRKLGRNK